MIYFIQMGKSGPIKIGRTKIKINQRLKSLQSASPYKLKILHVHSNKHGKVFLQEKEIHNMFSEIRLNGEWFEPSNELLMYINELKKDAFISDMGEDPTPSAERKFIQRNIADETGMSESLFSMILSGQRRPGWDKAKKLSEVTNTKIEVWMEGTTDEKISAIIKSKISNKD